MLITITSEKLFSLHIPTNCHNLFRLVFLITDQNSHLGIRWSFTQSFIFLTDSAMIIKVISRENFYQEFYLTNF